jgi:hypothetical protein
VNEELSIEQLEKLRKVLEYPAPMSIGDIVLYMTGPLAMMVLGWDRRTVLDWVCLVLGVLAMGFMVWQVRRSWRQEAEKEEVLDMLRKRRGRHG